MPTPRPISEPSSGATSGMSVTWLISIVESMPRPTPKTAMTIGSTIAKSEPKARKSTTAAAAMPTISAMPVGGSWMRVIAWPPSSTWRPERSACRAVSTTSWTTSLGTEFASSAKLTWA